MLERHARRDRLILTAAGYARVCRASNPNRAAESIEHKPSGLSVADERQTGDPTGIENDPRAKSRHPCEQTCAMDAPRDDALDRREQNFESGEVDVRVQGVWEKAVPAVLFRRVVHVQGIS